MTQPEHITVATALPDDLIYVMSLMRANRESVGGLPQPAILERIERGTILLGLINNDPVGYLLYDIRNRRLRIPQACIQYDARRRHYGEALVATLMQRHPDIDEISLRCAADLDSNVFWRDMGFTCTGTVAGGKRRGRTINCWAMWLEARLLTLDEISVLPAAERRVDTMYDDTGFVTAQPEGFQTIKVLPKLAWANRK